MKKLKYSKKMLLDAQSFLKTVENNYEKINKEYSKNIIKLLEAISIGENLDFKMLKDKYLNSPKEDTKTIISSDIALSNIVSTTIFSNITSSEEINDDNSSDTLDEIILDKININNINYYYENKTLGRIFDADSKIVGEYKDNKFYIFENS
jgi:hypothetical protein